MQAIRPSKPRLARFTILGELMYRTSSMLARGRISSTRCSSRMLAAMEMMRVAAANAVVRRRDLTRGASGLESAESFQVPALKDQNGTAQRHCSVKERIKTTLQDELSGNRLLMCNRADHVQRGKVGHKVGSRRRNRARDAVRHCGKSAQVIRKAAYDKQREGEYRRKQRRRK